MTRLLHQLKFVSNFVDQSLEFLSAHHERVSKSLDTLCSSDYQPRATPAAGSHRASPWFSPTAADPSAAPHAALTLGQLEETEAVTALLFQLAHYQDRWPLVLDCSFEEGSVALAIKHAVIKLLQHVALSVSHPANIIPNAKAVSVMERKAIGTAVRRGDDARDDDASCNGAESAMNDQPSFYRQIELHLYQILRNNISIARLYTPTLSNAKCTHAVIDSETLVPLFDPLPDANFNAAPTLGVLFVLVNTCLGALKKILPPSHCSGDIPPSFATVDTNLFLNDSPGSAVNHVVPLIVYTIESAVHVLVEHIHLYLSAPGYSDFVRRRVRDEIAYELEGLLSRLSRGWPKLLSHPAAQLGRRVPSNNSQPSFLLSVEDSLKRITHPNSAGKGGPF